MLQEKKFIDNPIFSQEEEIAKILQEELPKPANVSWFFKINQLASLKKRCKNEHISKDIEKILFIQLNYARKQLAIGLDSEKWKNKIKEIQGILINNYVALILSISRKFVKTGLNFDDVVSTGYESLLHAINMFDVNKGYRFSTYATYNIRNALIKQLKERNDFLRQHGKFNKNFLRYIYEVKNDNNTTHGKKSNIERDLIDEMKEIIENNVLGFNEVEIDIIKMRFVGERVIPYAEVCRRLYRGRWWVKNHEQKIVQKIKNYIDEKYL